MSEPQDAYIDSADHGPALCAACGERPATRCPACAAPDPAVDAIVMSATQFADLQKLFPNGRDAGLFNTFNLANIPLYQYRDAAEKAELIKMLRDADRRVLAVEGA